MQPLLFVAFFTFNCVYLLHNLEHNYAPLHKLDFGDIWKQLI